jgi:hypothetical protein
MSLKFDPDELRTALAELDDDQRRVEETLAQPLPVALRHSVLGERRWLEHRRARLERLPVECVAVLRAGRRTAAVRVRDVSVGGALVEVDDPPEVGAKVRLELSGLDGEPDVPCIVRHREPERRTAGLEFLIRQATEGRELRDQLVARFGVKGT